MPQDVPLIVNVPEDVVTQPLAETPDALPVPFAAVPVIVRLPPPVDDISALR